MEGYEYSDYINGNNDTHVCKSVSLYVCMYVRIVRIKKAGDQYVCSDMSYDMYVVYVINSVIRQQNTIFGYHLIESSSQIGLFI